MSCSYGPGRYDSHYEEEGHDYPIGFVRWTEQRNFEAVLDLLTSRSINTDCLVTQRFLFADAKKAYDDLTTSNSHLGILLEYPIESFQPTDTIHFPWIRSQQYKIVCAGFIGAGNYASRVLIPAFKEAGVRLKTIACNAGVSGTQTGKKFGFESVTTDANVIFSDPEINTVVIATRHDSHAYLTINALRAKKHVFVEKPLCLSFEELNAITDEVSTHASQYLMIGFNRRFSPLVDKVKKLLSSTRSIKTFIMTVNAGFIPETHWTQHKKAGGGRIIGEACHFIDLLRFLAASPITHFQVMKLHPLQQDHVSLALSFADGSSGIIHYLINGHSSFPKERLEIFTAGKILQLDNFRYLKGYGWREFKKMNLWRQDKGQGACIKRFVEGIEKGLPPLIPLNEIVEVSRVSLEMTQAIEFDMYPCGSEQQKRDACEP